MQTYSRHGSENEAEGIVCLSLFFVWLTSPRLETFTINGKSRFLLRMKPYKVIDFKIFVNINYTKE